MKRGYEESSSLGSYGPPHSKPRYNSGGNWFTSYLSFLKVYGFVNGEFNFGQILFILFYLMSFLTWVFSKIETFGGRGIPDGLNSLEFIDGLL